MRLILFKIFILFFFYLSFNFSFAQEIIKPEIKIYKGEIINILENKKNKNFVVKIDDLNETKILESNGLNYNIGTKVYVENRIEKDGSDYWLVTEAIRINSLIILFLIFIFTILILFGLQGLKSLISLFISFLIIFFILIPLTLKGYNPILIASLISTILLLSVMLITHGKNRITTSSFLGCLISILITIIISYLSVKYNYITGFASEDAIMLFYNAEKIINFQLLIIASIIISVIGVIDDGSITQAKVVAELKNLNPNLTIKEYYQRAMRVGGSHAGAMINTLILAYTGSSLILLLLIKTTEFDIIQIINKEIIATEIIRAIVGSIGILLCIPLTTIIAAYLVKKEDIKHGHHH